MKRKRYTGYTKDTPESLLLDAGAFFKNFTIGTDTYASAVTAGKLIGATKGGGEFAAVPEIRQTEVDGIPGKAKGMENVDGWDIHIKANVIEVKEDTLKIALVGATVDTTKSDDYDIIRAGSSVEDSSYTDNITWIGNLSGSEKPVIIQIYNALNTEGLTLQTQDKAESVISMTFDGHFDEDDYDTPPFAIYYPKAETAATTEGE